MARTREDVLSYHQAYYRAHPEKFNQPEARERQKQWAKDNAQRVRDAAARNRAKKRQIVLDAKAVPCLDCGVSYPSRVMEFDHVRGEKLGNVSVLVAKASEQRIRDEIAKCDVVCANCHRLRHIERGDTT